MEDASDDATWGAEYTVLVGAKCTRFSGEYISKVFVDRWAAGLLKRVLAAGRRDRRYVWYETK